MSSIKFPDFMNILNLASRDVLLATNTYSGNKFSGFLQAITSTIRRLRLAYNLGVGLETKYGPNMV